MMNETILIVVNDLMFQPRIAEAARALGMEARVADAADAVAEALGAPPAVVVVDVHAAGIDAAATIRAAREAGARVLAFGRHTDAAALRAAREAGADRVVARSQLVEQLGELIASLAQRPRAG
jgi:DNA-binding NarL/FixJ family response regulator